MRAALAAIGGALTMLVVVAVWQARSSAAELHQNAWPSLSAVTSPPNGVPSYMPVAYQPAAGQPSSDLVQLDAVRAVPVRYVSREPVRERVVYREGRHRNWAKTALVIGGSAGAGAGVGALAGGQKGALVGAALGGGVASLFEALKR